MKKPVLSCCPDAMRPHVAKVLAGEYDLPPHLDLIDAPTRVLDIGANVGAYTAWARWRWPAAEIRAFEPVPETFETLETNHGGDAKTYLHRFALSNREGTMELRLGAHNCGEASAYDLGEQSDETITVDVIDATAIIRSEVVKIDAEGAEGDILSALDLSETDVVAYEWHGRERREECSMILGNLDFERVGETVFTVDRGVDVWARPGSTRPRSIGLREQHAGVPHVFLALPIYGGIDAGFHESMMDLVTTLPRPYGLRVRNYVGDSLVSRARNRLAAQFLRSDSTHLLFIDSDLIFSPEHVARVIAHGEPIVAGLYPKKQADLGWVCNMLEPSPEPDERDLQPVKYAGTGFLCIAREVFEAMISACPDLRYDPDEGEQEPGSLWDFFRVGVWQCPETGRRRYLSEDWWFCQMARDLGFTIWMDTRVVLKHVGQAVYPLQAIDTFADAVGGAVGG